MVCEFGIYCWLSDWKCCFLSWHYPVLSGLMTALNVCGLSACHWCVWSVTWGRRPTVSVSHCIPTQTDVDVVMRMASSAGTFSEQIGVVVDWFNSWNDCEKVVALYCLLRKLPPPQTKFLCQVLDQIVASCSPIDLEEQANDPGRFHVHWLYINALNEHI